MDDILAMLLAFSAKADELDVLMLSLTFGNVEVQKYVDIFFSLSCSLFCTCEIAVLYE